MKLLYIKVVFLKIFLVIVLSKQSIDNAQKLAYVSLHACDAYN